MSQIRPFESGQRTETRRTNETCEAHVNDLPLDVKQAIRAAIRDTRERFSETRYPYTYSADFLRAHPDIVPAEIRKQLVVVHSRSDAAQAKELWAKKLQVAERVLVEELANAYLVEHGIDRSLP